jgi:uncharacterized protein YuzE
MEASIRSGHFGRLDVDYDQEADVLYVAIGQPRPADTYDAPHGLLVRKDPQTREVVGVTVLHYDHSFKKLRDLSWLKELKLPGDLEQYLTDQR